MVRRLNILDHTGHTTLEYSEEKSEQVNGVMSIDEAERAFGNARARGYMAYAERDGGPEVVRGFDPNEKEITMAPQIVGG